MNDVFMNRNATIHQPLVDDLSPTFCISQVFGMNQVGGLKTAFINGSGRPIQKTKSIKLSRSNQRLL
jgi:hypothetical protein